MNWKKLSEEKPPMGAYIMIDTGATMYQGWVLDENPAGFEYWCYIEDHNGTVYAPERPYTTPIAIENAVINIPGER